MRSLRDHAKMMGTTSYWGKHRGVMHKIVEIDNYRKNHYADIKKNNEPITFAFMAFEKSSDTVHMHFRSNLGNFSFDLKLEKEIFWKFNDDKQEFSLSINEQMVEDHKATYPDDYDSLNINDYGEYVCSIKVKKIYQQLKEIFA